ncbi:MAG: metallophosphatase [Flavobacteriales bacterium]|nr:metallophosphatase [Flavobacteriales bacterium]
MTNRRTFIKNTTLGTLGLSLIHQPLCAEERIKKITILHTNDMHSRIEPFRSGRNQGLGGMAQRSSLITDIRKKEKNVLLLDAGDIFQGTPYFNFYGGELEFKLMSEMKYDAATLGNHDFDNGIEGLEKQLKHADFPFIIANYDFSNTILKDKFKPYKVFNKEGIRIGVFGIGIKLDGLVPKELYKETMYLDPIKTSNYYSNKLKNELGCDLVICLSHLGYKYNSDRISDFILAQKTRDIDLIIGGHTHTFLKKPKILSNLRNEKVIINQVGWGGINIGKIDFIFKQNQRIFNVKKSSILVKKNKTP